MRRLALLVLCPALSLAACSDEGGVTLGPEPIVLPECPYAFEAPEHRSYVSDRLELLGPGQGTDLDGDGDIDNELGFLSAGINAGWDASIRAGSAMFVWDFTDLDETGNAVDRPVGLTMYVAGDADSVIENNLGGEGEFLVPVQQFDVDCSPTSEWQSTIQDGFHVTGTTDHWEVVVPYLGGAELADLTADLDFTGPPDDRFRSWNAEASGVWTYCGVAFIPFPGPTPGTMLEELINNFQVLADIDRDDDGLEQVVGTHDGSGIDHCIDGDGTIIPGAGCPCEPEIADGYSFAIYTENVPARIIGTYDFTP